MLQKKRRKRRKKSRQTDRDREGGRGRKKEVAWRIGGVREEGEDVGERKSTGM